MGISELLFGGVGQTGIREATNGKPLNEVLAKGLGDGVTKAVDENAEKVQQIMKELQLDFQKGIDGNIKTIFERLAPTGDLLRKGLIFTSLLCGLAKFYMAYQGQQAEHALMRLGVEINKSLKSSADSAKQQLNLKIQEKFADHVHDYVSMVSSSEQNALIFIYHPGTDWHPKFFNKRTTHPLPQLGAVLSDMDTMLLFLAVLRKVAGPNLVFKILVPATNLLAITDEIPVPPELMPLTFECERNSEGQSYVHVNIPGAPPEMLRHVVNISRIEKTESWERWTAANAGCWATALPIAGAGTFMSLAAVGLALETAIGGTAVAVGVATAGAATAVAMPVVVVVGLPVLLAGTGWAAFEGAIASKRSVRAGFKKDDEKKEKEAARRFVEAACA